MIKLIVGLGNPGRIYRDSRHNIGWMTVKVLSKGYKISLKKDEGSLSLVGKGKIKDQDVVLALPLTFMNLSGIAVKALLKKYKIGLENLLVVCDDLDLELGRFKIKPSGSFGGHRGLKSIIDSLGSQSFSRLRIGIGRPSVDIDIARYVLLHFTKKQRQEVKNIIEKVIECCRVWITKGIRESMNIFNR